MVPKVTSAVSMPRRSNELIIPGIATGLSTKRLLALANYPPKVASISFFPDPALLLATVSQTVLEHFNLNKGLYAKNAGAGAADHCAFVNSQHGPLRLRAQQQLG
jgi:hypothetical protein